MGKPLGVVWCRKCVAAHPEGEHLKRAAPAPSELKRTRTGPVEKIGGYAAPVQAAAVSVTPEELRAPPMPKRSHPPQPVNQPKPKKDQSVKAKKIKKAVAAAAVTAEVRAPANMKAPKRAKPFKDPAKELARRKRLKADQMKRYRANRAKRLAEQGLTAKGDLK